MSKPITLTELLLEIGDDNLAMQPLGPAVTNMAKRRDYNEVSFATETPFSMKGLAKTGLVVWVDRDVFDAAVKRLKEHPND
ncbi:MAG: hypothetical protein FH747_02950 [Stenotrophomonas sp.]|uniref:hypothetical protein n=1 Tax=Stenotrophomonas sp. TaxID=69392 RepID=UPI0013524010|nr:hypothetical protein [Stenotrophomonas sp.]MTI72545.1 hypothetical protein [Stenotrophomonas sp.]MTI72605.1 hypothetical protein [Stenotrophomonas sp.]